MSGVEGADNPLEAQRLNERSEHSSGLEQLQNPFAQALKDLENLTGADEVSERDVEEFKEILLNFYRDVVFDLIAARAKVFVARLYVEQAERAGADSRQLEAKQAELEAKQAELEAKQAELEVSLVALGEAEEWYEEACHLWETFDEAYPGKLGDRTEAFRKIFGPEESEPERVLEESTGPESEKSSDLLWWR